MSSESYTATPQDIKDWQRGGNRISSWNRRRKWRLFCEHMLATSGSTNVLDVGYSNEEYSSTDNFIEKHFPHLQHLTALGVEQHDKFSARYPAVSVVRYDGGKFPFRDNEFDVVWSNAVVEHVGDRRAQVRFLSEIQRVGRRAFVTTPNRHFPIEVHTRTPLLHYLPKTMFDGYLRVTGKAWAADDYMRLLGVRELRNLLYDAGLKKSEFSIHRNRIGPFTLDFVVLMHGHS